MYEEIIQRLRNLGLDDQMANELFNALADDIITNMLQELTEKSTDEEMLTYENRIKESKSPEHFQTIINEIAVKVYGDNATTEIKKNFDILLEELDKTIKDARDLMIQAQNGDPSAQNLINKAQQTDLYKDVVSGQ